MPAKLEEITAVFLAERFRKEDFIIGSARTISNGDGVPSQDISVLGNAEIDERDGSSPLTSQCEYRFYGRFENNVKHGRQFRFDTFVRAQPHSRGGIIRYLQESPGIGLATATAIWNKFGPDSVKILREKPEVVSAAVQRFPPDKAEIAAEHFRKLSSLESCTIELIDLLAGRGFPKKTGAECVKKWGNKAPEIIRRNPYVLMSFRGCGFLRCDAMYLDLGLPAQRLKRQALCAWYAIASDTEGHTWYPDYIAVKGIKAKVGGTDVDPEKAIRLAARAGMIRIRWTGNNFTDVDANGKGATARRWIAEEKKAAAEDYVARHLAEAADEKASWPAADNLSTCSDHQQSELSKALTGIVGLFGGRPGTGKTYTIAALAKLLVDRYGSSEVAIACPTGKAAVRCNEAMQSYGLTVEARTIHRLLGVNSAEGGNWSFIHNEYNPLPCRFVLLDEQSMTDVALFAHVLKARGKGTHILCVGDVNQLSPVGHGAPLRDMIAAGLPYGELREIRRNAGTIVRACAAIVDQQPIPLDQQLDPENTAGLEQGPRNLKLIPANKEKAAERLLECVRKLKEMAAAGSGIDPVWDVQILVAVNKRSALSRKDLNKQLQLELNPAGMGVGGSPFRVGDKVICLKNGFMPLYDEDSGKASDEKVFVANGELGEVLIVESKKTIVEFSNPERVVLITRGATKDEDGDRDSSGKSDKSGDGKDDDSNGTGCDLDLAYAITTHKSQGSEFPIVIVALDEYPGATGQFGVCDRAWLYTSISRARKICLLVGRISTAQGMCSRVKIHARKTFLTELIGEYREQLGRVFDCVAAASSVELAGSISGTGEAVIEWPV